MDGETTASWEQRCEGNQLFHRNLRRGFRGTEERVSWCSLAVTIGGLRWLVRLDSLKLTSWDLDSQGRTGQTADFLRGCYACNGVGWRKARVRDQWFEMGNLFGFGVLGGCGGRDCRSHHGEMVD